MTPALRNLLLATTATAVLGTAAAVLHAGDGAKVIARESAVSADAPAPQMTTIEASGGYSVEALPPLIAGTVGQPLVLRPRQILEGTPPFRRQIVGPADAILSPNGSITIVPGKPGLSGPYTLSVTDARDRTVSTQTYVEVSAPLRLDGSVARSGIVGQRFSSQLSPIGGRPPYAWSFSGNLPPGLSFVNGEISGTPSQPGRFDGMVVTVLDADNRQSYSGSVAIDVGAALTLSSLPATIDAVVGKVHVLPPIEIKGGTPPYRRTLTGPEGATLRPDGGVEILPRRIGAIGPFDLAVTDLHGQSASTRITVNAVQPMSVGQAEPPILVVGVESSVPAPSVAGGVAPFTYGLVGTDGRDPPAGMALLPASGVLVGSPAKAGVHGPYRVEVRDATGATALSEAFEVPVFPARDDAYSQKEVLVDGTRCAASGGWDCLAPSGVRTIEFRYPAPRRVAQAEFGCDYVTQPIGVWDYWNGQQWLPVDLTGEGACFARFRTVATTAVRFSAAAGPLRRVWTARTAQ